MNKTNQYPRKGYYKDEEKSPFARAILNPQAWHKGAFACETEDYPGVYAFPYNVVGVQARGDSFYSGYIRANDNTDDHGIEEWYTFQLFLKLVWKSCGRCRYGEGFFTLSECPDPPQGVH